MKKILSGFLALGLAAALTPAVSAQTSLSFSGITNNSSSNTSSGEQQLTVDVFNAGGGLRGVSEMVAFTFTYMASDSSAITDIYFDDGTLLALASISNGPGVLFEQGANPGNLPGGNEASPPFEATAGFTADSSAPMTLANGVGNGETLTIYFELQYGKTFEDVLQDLMTGALRIGMHVQGFADGGSESFVNNPLEMIPLPSAGLMGLAGLCGVAARRRR